MAAYGGCGGGSWHHQRGSGVMIHGFPVDQVVAVIIAITAAVMALPVTIGLAMIIIDIVLWFKERREKR